MRRPPLGIGFALVVVSLVVLGACSGDRGSDVPTPSRITASVTPPTPTVTAAPTGTTSPVSHSPITTPSASPGVEADDVRLPADGPTAVTASKDLARIAAGDLSSLVPPGATVGFHDVRTTPEDPLDQISLTWDRGEDFFAAEHGFVVWQPSDDGWHAVYAFTDPVRKQILGLSPLQSGDLTGDGLPDLLTLEQRGGSGACGIMRVISSTDGDAREVYRATACDTRIDIVGDHLERREAVFGPNDPHCCPSSFRVIRLAWDGSAFAETGSTTEPA